MPAIPARISLVSLGVADVVRSTAFYESLGWRRSSSSQDGVISFFHTSGAILDLYEAGDLAEDADLPRTAADPAPRPFPGFTLAINLASRDEVDDAFAAVAAAGARIVKPPKAADWGGYSGYFADPDGFLWEVAHNPGWPLDERGLPRLP
jgi:catechol 2,3-dioxygenase-like lactoylglutathione lyase family enzyme